ncbi:MAG: response regulator [Bacteroidetes bacterium HGW-Bacteroidetes-1]|jgi:CheY-like chemotaxis protein|nr:MAG: response regulator [Bacteroidetes bacterium HGW-Bacteroidetes-1]
MKLKALIIEDNEQNMYMLSFLLEKNNYDVIQAFNGIDGIKAAKERMPDVILLDIQLPEMDGYHVAQELRKRNDLLHIPIVAVTSHAMVGDKEKALESGATGYIEKPIDPDTFIPRMESFFTAELLKRRNDL